MLAAGSVILLAIALGALSHLRRSPAGPPPAPPKPAAPALGAEVVLLGKVRAQHLVTVAALTEGAVEGPVAQVGEEVFEGQLLARVKNSALESARDEAKLELDRMQTRVNNLDASLIAARLEASRAEADASRARTEFERAQKAFERQKLLYKEGATPRLTFEKAQKEFEDLQTEYTNLSALAKHADERVASLVKELDLARRILNDKEEALEQAVADLQATEVHAPVDGIVVASRAEPGQFVTRETKDLFQIAVDLSLLEVTLEPEPPVLERIRPGQPAVVQVAEMGGEGLPGEVKRIEGTVVIVEFTSPSPAIRPGLTAHVRIKIG